MTSLENIPLFSELKPGELEELRLIAQERSFAAGQEIFREGLPGDGIYFVKSGMVVISSGEAGRHVFSRLGPGEIFGEMAIIEDRPRSATAAAALDSQVYFLPKGEMLPVIERSPRLAFALLQHISQRLRAFTQLHIQELVQSESLAVIGRFAQGIVHDLKNPLNIISLAAEMFDLPGLNPEIRATARPRIRRQVERISDMVSDILIFTQNARKNAELKAADYSGYIQQLVGDLRAEAELKAASIELENLPSALQVRFDPRCLSRVFFNLVGNATDAMPNGGKIYLRFHATAEEITTEVEDTGPGTAPEIAGHLFQPFSTFGKKHGTGLGLAICRRIVEDHGGRIFARNEPGRGAIFGFTLPIVR